MKLSEMKKKALAYRDFYGGDLLNVDMVDKAKTKNQLFEIIDRHTHFLELQSIDALTDFECFKRTLEDI